MAEATKNEMVTVEFHGDQLQAMQDASGTIWVVAKRVAESLGVDWRGQFVKLESQPWAVMEIISTTGSDGKNYQMRCVDSRTLLMWLATIQSSKVNESARLKLIRYQNEVADVLEAYFRGETVQRSAEPVVDATRAMPAWSRHPLFQHSPDDLERLAARIREYHTLTERIATIDGEFDAVAAAGSISALPTALTSAESGNLEKCIRAVVNALAKAEGMKMRRTELRRAISAGRLGKGIFGRAIKRLEQSELAIESPTADGKVIALLREPTRVNGRLAFGGKVLGD